MTACLAAETARLRGIRRQLTDEAEHWWQALLANARLVEIRDKLHARVAEAERERRLGEVEGPHVGLARARDQFARLDAEQTRTRRALDLGMPTRRHVITGREGTSPRSPRRRPSAAANTAVVASVGGQRRASCRSPAAPAW
jgi:hypothetical protein